jgi:phosphoribosyl-AMP cyclohydrolase
MEILEKLKFDSNGLIPVVAQDFKDGTVLMVAYMNKEAVKRTIQTGNATYWSRSRQKFWIKGEQSGNIQKVKDMYFDCDADCLLIKIEQVGGAACHTGHRSCFFNKVTKDGGSKTVGKKVFDPKKVYK